MIEEPLERPRDPGDASATSEPTATPAAAEGDEETAEPMTAETAESGRETEPEQGAEPRREAEPEGEAELDRAAEPAVAAAEPEPVPAAEPEAVALPLTAPTVATVLADTLRAAGVKFAFTVPGESFLPLLDACVATGIRVIATRHEGGAAFMAEAYGQLTGRPAACFATRAVGAANLAIGIHTARADSTPMFAIVGQVHRSVRGREAFQEADLVASIGRYAKWSVELDDPARAASAIAEASRQALGGRPGPVLISVPEDLLDEELGEAAATAGPRTSIPGRLDPTAVHRVVQLLAAARRPVILAGAGVLRARGSRDLLRLAELLHVPVIASWRRGDVISNDHPLYLGMTGYYAPPSVRARLDAADALLVIGCRLNEVTTFGYAIPREGLSWAHVDLEPRPAGDAANGPMVSAPADAGAFLRSAIGRLEGAVLDAENVSARDAANAADRSSWEQGTSVDTGEWDGPGVHPGRVIAALRSALPDDAILTTDAGNFGGWLARGFRFRKPGTFLGPTSGAMGYALPAAISAAIVHRDRPVVAVAGDGGFAMTMSELETAVRERARLTVVVFDNERYGTIRAHQDRVHTQPIATDLGPVDFAGVARALGARAERIESTDAFEPALRTALAADGPSVLHLVLDRAWRSVDDHP